MKVIVIVCLCLIGMSFGTMKTKQYQFQDTLNSQDTTTIEYWKTLANRSKLEAIRQKMLADRIATDLMKERKLVAEKTKLLEECNSKIGKKD